MALLRVTEDSTPSELREAIGHLRAKQRAACDQQVRDELDEAMGELLDRLPRGGMA